MRMPLTSGSSPAPRFAVVADDNTGATDSAGMLTAEGVRTILFIDIPAGKDLSELASGYDAVVMAMGTRSIEAAEAYRLTAESVGTLAQLGTRKMQLKISSTFDSTPQGNIGPSLDACLDVLDAPGTIVCPALPVNGRTVRAGILYVYGVPLTESYMKDHPLNPMTGSDIVRWLQAQTRRKVSLVGLAAVRSGVKSLEEALADEVRGGASYVVTDAVEQSDLDMIARATADWALVSGASGITSAMPGAIFGKMAALSFEERLAELSGPVLVAAGSCSPATRAQNAMALRSGFAGIEVSGLEVLDGKLDAAAVSARARAELDKGKSVLLHASAGADEVERVQQRGREKGLSIPATGEKVACALAELCARVLDRPGAANIVISGGETSRAVCSRLGIRALEVGLPMDSGVPYCFPTDGRKMAVVLKSGDFGSEDLYVRVAGLGAGKQ